MYLYNSKARTTGNMSTGYCSNSLYRFTECSHEQIVNYLEETKKIFICAFSVHFARSVFPDVSKNFISCFV